jgi:hypothetical protein
MIAEVREYARIHAPEKRKGWFYGVCIQLCDSHERLRALSSERPTLSQADALVLITAERDRQVSAEGWSQEHDDAHDYGELARAAAMYATPKAFRPDRTHAGVPFGWPWDAKFWKPTPDDRIRELVKAGALIVAEIERLRRAALLGEKP